MECRQCYACSQPEYGPLEYIGYCDYDVIVRKTKKQKLAEILIDFALMPEIQQKFLKDIAKFALRKCLKVSDDMKGFILDGSERYESYIDRIGSTWSLITKRSIRDAIRKFYHLVNKASEDSGCIKNLGAAGLHFLGKAIYLP
jgi:hypothetical protein